jgi:hypothetical protein
MDVFVADNMDMSDVDFEDVFVGHGDNVGHWWDHHLKGKDMVIILVREVIIGIRTIILSSVEIWIQLS